VYGVISECASAIDARGLAVGAGHDLVLDRDEARVRRHQRVRERHVDDLVLHLVGAAQVEDRRETVDLRARPQRRDRRVRGRLVGERHVERLRPRLAGDLAADLDRRLAALAVAREHGERLPGEQVRQRRRRRVLHVEALPVDRDVGEVRLVDHVEDVVDHLVAVVALGDDDGRAAAELAHVGDEVAVHRRADPEREQARVADVLADLAEDLVLVADEAVGHEDDDADLAGLVRVGERGAHAGERVRAARALEAIDVRVGELDVVGRVGERRRREAARVVGVVQDGERVVGVQARERAVHELLRDLHRAALLRARRVEDEDDLLGRDLGELGAALGDEEQLEVAIARLLGVGDDAARDVLGVDEQVENEVLVRDVVHRRERHLGGRRGRPLDDDLVRDRRTSAASGTPASTLTETEISCAGRVPMFVGGVTLSPSATPSGTKRGPIVIGKARWYAPFANGSVSTYSSETRISPPGAMLATDCVNRLGRSSSRSAADSPRSRAWSYSCFASSRFLSTPSMTRSPSCIWNACTAAFSGSGNA
jgi:hypothetical protein